MITRSKTSIPIIDFDESSKAWNENKRRLGNGTYEYLCKKYPSAAGGGPTYWEHKGRSCHIFHEFTDACSCGYNTRSKQLPSS